MSVLEVFSRRDFGAFWRQLTNEHEVSYIVYGDYRNTDMPKTSVVSSRLDPEQELRLAKMAKNLGRTPSETGALLIEEGLRRAEFAFIDFRDSPAGRQAYLQGSTLAVWEVAWIARGYHNNAEKTAAHFEMSPLKVKAALNYSSAFPEEIGSLIQEHEETDFSSLSRMVPQAEIFPPLPTGRR